MSPLVCVNASNNAAKPLHQSLTTEKKINRIYRTTVAQSTVAALQACQMVSRSFLFPRTGFQKTVAGFYTCRLVVVEHIIFL